MELSAFLKYRGIILFLLLITIIVIAFFWINNVNQPNGINPTASLINTSPLVTSPLSTSSATISTPLSRKPEDIQAMLQQGISLYQNHDYQGSISAFNKVLSLAPNNILAYNGRGAVYTDLKDYEKAIQDYSKVIELEPLFPAAYYNRGRVYAFLKNYDKAILDLQQSIQLSPSEFGYNANGNIGLIFHQQGQYDKALESFAAAISYNDKKADTYYLRGETLSIMGNYQAAITDYQAAIQRFPKYGQTYQSLGYAYYKTQQFSQAQEALKQALTITPNSPIAHFYLMLVYLSTNDITSANTAVSQAVNSLSTLSEEDQQFILTRIQSDLKIFAQENPAKTQDVDSLTKLIPKPN